MSKSVKSKSVKSVEVVANVDQTVDQSHVIDALNAQLATLQAMSVPSDIQKKKKTIASYKTFLNNPERYGQVKQVDVTELKSLLADGMTLDNMHSSLIQSSVNKWKLAVSKLEFEIEQM